jgi:hypothetical protein
MAPSGQGFAVGHASKLISSTIVHCIALSFFTDVKQLNKSHFGNFQQIHNPKKQEKMITIKY